MNDSDSVSERLGQLVARDALPASLGIEYVDGGLGRAVVKMRVVERHLNCNGTCHGGVIFTLADTAFGLASNSYGRVAAGIDAHITYHIAARLGEVLSSTATEISRNRKLGVYRIDVTAADGRLIASFTGTAFISDRTNGG